MVNEHGRTRARLAVHAELAHRGWNTARLASESGTDPGTTGDFLNGARWIKVTTQGKFERALQWPPGTIASIVAGMEPPPLVGATDEHAPVEEDTLLYRRPEGLSDEDWERVKRESRGFIEWQIQRAAQER